MEVKVGVGGGGVSGWGVINTSDTEATKGEYHNMHCGQVPPPPLTKTDRGPCMSPLSNLLVAIS